MTVTSIDRELTCLQDTHSLGESIGSVLVEGLTIGLVGPLGAGKTHLVKGIATGNGIEDAQQVTSPTFTLVHEYPGTFPLYHLDTYRLGSGGELLALGFDEMVQAGGTVVVEWADRVRDVMPDDTLWIELTITGDTQRSVRLRSTGPISAGVLDGLRSAEH